MLSTHNILGKSLTTISLPTIVTTMLNTLNKENDAINLLKGEYVVNAIIKNKSDTTLHLITTNTKETILSLINNGKLVPPESETTLATENTLILDEIRASGTVFQFLYGSQKIILTCGNFVELIKDDFTPNMLVANVHGEVFDPTQMAEKSIKAKEVATNEDPTQIFLQNPLQVLHGILYSKQYGFPLSQALDQAIIFAIPLLKYSNPNDINYLFKTFLLHSKRIEIFNELATRGIIFALFPEITQAINFKNIFDTVADQTISLPQFYVQLIEHKLYIAEHFARLQNSRPSFNRMETITEFLNNSLLAACFSNPLKKQIFMQEVIESQPKISFILPIAYVETLNLLTAQQSMLLKNLRASIPTLLDKITVLQSQKHALYNSLGSLNQKISSLKMEVNAIATQSIPASTERMSTTPGLSQNENLNQMLASFITIAKLNLRKFPETPELAELSPHRDFICLAKQQAAAILLLFQVYLKVSLNSEQEAKLKQEVEALTKQLNDAKHARVLFLQAQQVASQKYMLQGGHQASLRQAKLAQQAQLKTDHNQRLAIEKLFMQETGRSSSVLTQVKQQQTPTVAQVLEELKRNGAKTVPPLPVTISAIQSQRCASQPALSERHVNSSSPVLRLGFDRVALFSQQKIVKPKAGNTIHPTSMFPKQ